MALEDAWSILKGAPAPAWTRNIAESPKFITGGYEDPVAGLVGATGHDGTRNKHGLRNTQHFDNKIQTNEALSNMRQGANVDLRQGQLDTARKERAANLAAWRENERGYNALNPPRTLGQRALDKLLGRKHTGVHSKDRRMTEEEVMQPEHENVEWRRQQREAAKKGRNLYHDFSSEEKTGGSNPYQVTQPFSDTHQVQRMPAPGVGAESSFNTNPADAPTSAFDPTPRWQGQEQPKQQQSWVPPTQ